MATGKKVDMIIPSEVRGTGRDKYHDITSRYKLKLDTNEPIAQDDLERKLLVTKIQRCRAWSITLLLIK